MDFSRCCAAVAALALFAAVPVLGQTTAERFIDFDAAVDGDGTAESPWNTLVGKPIEGAQDITVWVQGEAGPLDVPSPIAASAEGVDVLRLKSRHLVDPSAPRAHFTRSIRFEELEFTTLVEGVYRVTFPSEAGIAKAVLRDWEVPAHRPIPLEGLQPGLAFDRDYVESFRITEQPNVALRPALNLTELQTMPSGFVAFSGSLYVKTPSGDPPGQGDEPPYRLVTHRPSQQAFMAFQSFQTPRVETVEVAGIIVSLHLKESRRRAMQFNPGENVTVRDCLFVACTDDDNIAVVNAGAPDHTVAMLRNQHIGIGADGGPIVVSTQASSTPYGRFVIEDQVVHYGYRLQFLDGADAGLAQSPRFGIGAFHGGKADRVEVNRCIALAYNGMNMIPFQFPSDADQLPLDARDADAYPTQVSDVYLDAVARYNDFNFNGVHIARSYFGPTTGQLDSLTRDLASTMYSSCVFEVNSRFNVLGNVGTRSSAFVNCTVRVSGRDEVALFGVGDETGSVYVRDLVVERVGGTGTVRLANQRDSFNPPPFRPDAILGWDGTTDLGAHWFAPGTLGGSPVTLQSPAFASTPATYDEFVAVHGDAFVFGPTGAESLPIDSSPEDVFAAYSGSITGPQSAYASGPAGINGAAFNARLGAFQTAHPDACSMADVAAPFGVLDLSDVDVFIAGFAAQTAEADLASPPAVFDLSDIDRFIAGFAGGCTESW